MLYVIIVKSKSCILLHVRNSTSNLDNNQIKVKLAHIISMIGDAHTSVNLEFNENQFFYPLEMEWFEDELRVIGTDKQYENILGKRLIRINCVDVDEIMKEINLLISHENEQWLKAVNVKYIIMPDLLKLLNYAKEDKAEFHFLDNHRNVSKIILKPKELTDIKQISVQDLMPIKPVRLQYDTENPYNHQHFWSKYVEEDKILYFQYNQCIDKNVAKKVAELFPEKIAKLGYDYESIPNFEDFSKALINQINNNDVEKLVIDLRNNTGGSSQLMTSLVSKLKNIDKLNSRIYVIIGRNTFSSGVYAVVDLKEKLQAKVYGEPTGGNVNSYGEIKPLTLPNSKLQISYSTKYFDLSSKYKEAFIPDVPIIQSFDHYINGIDDAYEAIKEEQIN